MAQRKVNCEVYTDRGIVGKDGAEGKSAYQQAVEGGYQGTEEEFEQALASDIATVANNVTNINVVGNNIENVNTAVDNMSAIIAAPTAATQAAASASQAATSATNAQTSETNAATSASNAEASATNASASATISTTKASEATSSATSASASATSASTSATSASISSENAEIWAEGTDAQVTTLGGEHSSKGWANVSKQYAESIGSALKYKGSVSTYSALPSTGQEIGDTWNVLDTGDNYAWTGTEWDKLSGTVDLSAYRTSADQDIIDATKQDTISDLSTIREGAALGATSVQPEDLATVATSGSYTDLTNKPTIPAAVTETTVSGWGFTKNAGTVTSVKINGTAKNPTSGVVDLGTVLTAHQDISGKQDVISDLATIRSGASAGATAVQHGDLATVATSGMYSDLTGTPGVATADTLGLVKPDGTTITVTADGVISATGGSGSGTTGLSIGDVVYSYSSLSSENPGKLPLFTGETIASANTIYPEFYNWILAHTELQCTSEEYESALSTYGECAKYVIGDGSLRLPLIKNYIKAANPSEGIKNIEAGLPNITGYLASIDTGGIWGLIANASADNYNKNSGAFRAQNNGPYSQSVSTGKGVASGNLYFDASRSSAIYGKSSTVTPASTTLYPWVVAYTAAIPASTAQAAEFQQALSGKADTNLGNIPSNYDYVVESQVNADGSWYRKYKSGWVEQGGSLSYSAVRQKWEQITLLKPMQNLNYNITIMPLSAYRGNAMAYAIMSSVGNKTVTSFLANCWGFSDGDVSVGFTWTAEGQGA